MKPIIGYEGYFACPTGRIWATAKRRWGERYLKTWLIGHGYEMVMLYKDTSPTKFLVHRLIAQAFISNPDNLREVNHKDGNKLNNRPENLEWVSSKDNKKHAWNNGSYTHRGSNHWKTNLTEEKVRQIRKLREEGLSYSQIGKKIGCSPSNAGFVIKGVSWKHIV